MKFHKDGTIPDEPGVIWVFGSNLAGYHGKGAALVAAQKFGATLEVAIGFNGQSYAIPTKSWQVGKRLKIDNIASSIRTFLRYAEKHHDQEFFVTRVGCGLAGYKDEEIAPLFAGAPPNCSFAEEWRPWVDDEFPETLL